MSDGKVISMGLHAGNATMISPQQCLERMVERVGDQGDLAGAKKVLVLALDESDGEYDVIFSQAGMDMSECITLSVIAKALFLEDMGY